MLNRLIASAALFLMLYAGGAAGAECRSGVTADFLVSDAPKHDAVATRYTGADAVKLVAEINSKPPETSWVADEVVLLDNHGLMVILALIDHGCAVTMVRAGQDTWQETRDRLLGKAS